MQIVNMDTLECFACNYTAKTRTNFRNHLYTMRHHNNVKKMRALDEEQELMFSSKVKEVSSETKQGTVEELDDERCKSKQDSGMSRAISTISCNEDAFAATVANMDKTGMASMESVMWGMGICLIMAGSFMVCTAFTKL